MVTDLQIYVDCDESDYNELGNHSLVVDFWKLVMGKWAVVIAGVK